MAPKRGRPDFRRSSNEPALTYRGVTWHKHTGKWEAHVWVPRDLPRDLAPGVRRCSQLYVGGFDTAEEAARARDLVHIWLHGATAAGTNYATEEYAAQAVAGLTVQECITVARSAFRQRDAELWCPSLDSEPGGLLLPPESY